MRSAAPQVGGTITPYHLVLTRTDWLGWGLKPYMYCMPVIKTARDRAALRKAATSGEACYFLGTDSAPHPVAKKVAVNGIPGLFNAPVAIETYAKVFEEEDRARQARGLCLPQRSQALSAAAERRHDHAGKVCMDRAAGGRVEGPDEKALIYRGGETIEWKVVSG